MINDLMLERTINRVQEAPRGAKEDEHDEHNKLSFEDQIEKRLRKDPKDRDAYSELIDYFFQKGRYRRAEDSVKRALKQFPDDQIFTPQLLEIQRNRAADEKKKIAEQYKKAPSEALKARYIEQKKLYDQKTLEFLQYRLKLSPNETQLHWELGSFLMTHGRVKEAIAELQKAKVDSALAALALGQCFQHIKQYPRGRT